MEVSNQEEKPEDVPCLSLVHTASPKLEESRHILGWKQKKRNGKEIKNL